MYQKGESVYLKSYGNIRGIYRIANIHDNTMFLLLTHQFTKSHSFKREVKNSKALIRIGMTNGWYKSELIPQENIPAFLLAKAAELDAKSTTLKNLAATLGAVDENR